MQALSHYVRSIHSLLDSDPGQLEIYSLNCEEQHTQPTSQKQIKSIASHFRSSTVEYNMNLSIPYYTLMDALLVCNRECHVAKFHSYRASGGCKNCLELRKSSNRTSDFFTRTKIYFSVTVHHIWLICMLNEFSLQYWSEAWKLHMYSKQALTCPFIRSSGNISGFIFTNLIAMGFPVRRSEDTSNSTSSTRQTQ